MHTGKNKKVNSYSIAKHSLFFLTSGFIKTGFSTKVLYFSFKQRYKSYLNISCNTKVVNVKLKLTRHRFKKFNDKGLVFGYYHAIW